MYYLNLDTWNKLYRNSGLVSFNNILENEETNIFYTPEKENSIGGKYIFYDPSLVTINSININMKCKDVGNLIDGNNFQIDILRPDDRAISIAFDIDNAYIFNGEQWVKVFNSSHPILFNNWYIWNFVFININDKLIVETYLNNKLDELVSEVEVYYHKDFKQYISAVNNQLKHSSLCMLRQLGYSGTKENKTYIKYIKINPIGIEEPITEEDSYFTTGCDDNCIESINGCTEIAKEVYSFLSEFCDTVKLSCSDLGKNNEQCFIEWFCSNNPCNIGYKDINILQECFDSRTHLCKTIMFHSCRYTNNINKYCKEHSKLCISIPETQETNINKEQLEEILEINSGLEIYRDMFIDFLNIYCNSDLTPSFFYWVDITGGFNPLLVRFINLSTSIVDNCYGWNFNHLNKLDSSLEIEPLHTYNNPGVFISSLNCLALEDHKMSIPITIIPKLVIDFSYIITHQRIIDNSTEFTIEFTNLTNNINKIISYDWNFDTTNPDSNHSSERDPMLSFTISNNLLRDQEKNFIIVNLVVEHTCGFVYDVYKSSCEKEISFCDLDFNYNIIENISQKFGYLVRFDGLSNCDIKNPSWDFDDGNFGELESLFHMYNVHGDYTVTLTTEPSGIVSKVVSIEALPPIADFDITDVVNPNPNQESIAADEYDVYLTSRLLDSEVGGKDPENLIFVAPENLRFISRSYGEIDEHLWRFEDNHDTDSNEVNVNHLFNKSGKYKITLTVIGPGGSNTIMKKVNIRAFPPKVNFNIIILNKELPGSTSDFFTYKNLTIGEVDLYKWSFGDGEFSSEIEPIHQYKSFGMYKITLQAWGPGGYGVYSKSLTVSATTPICDFEVGYGPFDECRSELWLQEGEAIFPAYIKNNSEGEIAKYIWDFGDGTTFEQNDLESLYKRNRSFMSLVDHNKVNIVKIKEKYDVIITDEYTVELMDPLVYNIRNFCHAYNKSGTYTIILIVLGVNGLTSTCSQTINVLCRLPVPIFAVETPNGDYERSEFVFVNKTVPNCEKIHYHWRFEDGFSSNQEHINHAFSTGGWYDVTLTATNEAGSAEYTTTIYSRYYPPISNFNFIPNTGIESLTSFDFNDLSQNNIHTWILNFGDGTDLIRSQNPPNHIFQQANTYNVTLTVIGIGGQDSITKQVFVQYLPPIANFDFDPNIPYMGVETLTTYQFINLSSNYNRQIDSYLWEFDYNNINSTLINPSYKYENAGTYDVKLTAFGPGGQDSIIKQLFVQYLPPVANFTVDNLIKFTDQNFIFDNLSSGEITSYNWNFGDGSISSSFEPVHNYDELGYYNVSLTVVGPGGQDSISKTLTVFEGLEAIFTIDENIGCINSVFTFTNNSKGEIYSYLWNFGDSVTSNLQNPTHSYSSSGTKTITLTITGYGGTDSLTKQITIESNYVANFTFTPSSGIEQTTSFNFNNISSVDIDTYYWDFGDGTISTSQNPPNHIFQTPGMYNVSLTVAGPCGDDSIIKQIPIRYISPEAVFTVVSECCLNTQISFNNNSIGYITSWLWNFGDGATSNLKNPTHSYSSSGTKTITLTVSGPGGSNTTSNQIYVISSLVASFTFVPNAQTITTFSFTNTSSGLVDVDTIHWDFGDGSTSSLQNPIHDYSESGTYNVILTITNQCGTSTQTQTIRVYKTFIGMAWIDESDSIYTATSEPYQTHINSFKEFTIQLPKYTGSCQVPGRPETGVYYPAVGNPISNGIDILVETVGRPPAANELIDRFEYLLDRFADKSPTNVQYPDYLVLSVDISGSMNLSTIQPAYDSLKSYVRSNYPQITIRETTYSNEMWLSIWQIQLAGIL